jgi:hypothetical protein
MPTFPKTTVSSLQKAKPGSLVSLRDGAGKLVFGLRVSIKGEPEDAEEAALVVLTPVEGGIAATLVANRYGGSGPIVNGTTRVTDHGNGYSIHVHARDWDSDLKQRNFAFADAGLLLLNEGDGLRLAVAIPWAGGCEVLNLKTWVLSSAGVSMHVAAKNWTLTLPWTSDDVEWPLVTAPATPEEVITAIKK